MLRKIIYMATTVLTLTTTKGLANINGSTLQSFNPVSSNGDFVTVQSALALKPGTLNLGGFFDQAYNTLLPALDSSNQKFEVSNDILSSDIHFALGLLPNWEVGANLGSIHNASVDKDGFAQYYKVRGLTDFRVNTKINFLEIAKWNFAVNILADFPQIENDYFYGAGDVPLTAVELIGSVADGAWAWAANLGYNFRPNGPKIPNAAYEPVGDMWLGSGAVAYQFEQYPLKAVGEAWFAQPVGGTANYTKLDLTATEYLAGLKYKTFPSVEWQGGITRGTRGGISTPDSRFYVGLNWQIDELWKKSEPPVPPPVVVPVVVEVPNPAPVPVMAPAVGNFVISNINFQTNSAEISADYAAYLKKFANFIKAKPSYKSILITGFTDSTGTKDYNLILSQRRADAIKRQLVLEEQLLSEKIQTKGLGVENPIATNKTKAGRKLNRRIEMLVEE